MFLAALAILGVVSIPLFGFPEASEAAIERLYDGLTRYLGGVYLWAGALVLGFCVWIAFSRHGRVRLGDSAPQFSTIAWTAMLFCAGVATGILYWGSIEWAFYYDSPPFGLEPRSDEAIRWASSFGIFHWGPTGWAFYCLPALAMGHAYYARGIPHIRLSAACNRSGGVGRLIDLCFIVGLLGSTGTSLGFGAPMIAAAVGRAFGVEESYLLTVAIAVVCAGVFSTSVYLGLEKGIRTLSLVNMALMSGLLAYVVAVGPSAFFVERAAAAAVTVVTGFVKMHALAGPFDSVHYDFAREWTVFYWAWWIAVGPFMGIFIAQISRGRTLRQIVWGSLGLGSLGSAAFYLILGNYGLNLQLEGVLDVVAVNEAQGAPAAIIAVIASLPYEGVVVPMFALIGLVFLATTYDSASYALASSASAEGDRPPARWHRLFWALTLAVLPTALLAGDSGAGRLRSLQTASLIVSLPLLVIFCAAAVSLVRGLGEPGTRVTGRSAQRVL